MKYLHLLAITCGLAFGSIAWAEPLQVGKATQLGGQTATLTKLETLPHVVNDYTERCIFDSAENPKLKLLCERYELDKVVAAGKDEFDRQVLLMDWAHRQFKKFGRPSSDAKGALDILAAIADGHSFFCTQYAQVMVSAAASLGWIDRPLALRRHQGANKNGGSTEHTTTEIWSNQHRKWVMLDPTSNMYLEKGGVPLNAWEIRQEWFYNDGRELVIVVGKGRKRYRKADLPVFLARFEGFGDLTIDPDELDKYGFTGYIPNNNLMDAYFDYGKMVIVKDALCEGTQWHTRPSPANPAADLYFPLGQASLTLTAEGDKLRVSITTMTPNLDRFEIRTDGGDWRPSAETFEWPVSPGANRLEARTLNKFGVTGPVSKAEITID